MFFYTDRGLIVPKYEHIKIRTNKYVNVSDLTQTYLTCDGIKLANSIVYLHKITDNMTSDEVCGLDKLIK